MAKIAQNGVIGIDEVGRGPFAGPVTVCAVYLEDEKIIRKEIFGNTIRDSKKLTKANREYIYKTIRENGKLEKKVVYAISSRTAEHIDKHGIMRSIHACVSSCMKSLKKQGINITNTDIRLDAGLIVPETGFRQKSFVKGDERYTEIALASIIAKVRRDTYMEKLAKIHVQYGWERNAGYGTQEHRNAIKKHGLTKHHRKTYVKGYQNQKN